MKKIILVLILAALVSNISFAQSSKSDTRKSFQFGLKVGSNFSNVYDTKDNTFKSDVKMGLAAGAFLTLPIGSFFGIQPEILYSEKGYKSTGTTLGNAYTLTRTSSFIDVPIFLAIKPVKFLSILVGPQYSYLLKERNVFSNSLMTVVQEQEFNNTNVRKNILCLVGGVDLNFDRVVIGARGGWDMQNNKGDGTSTTPQYKNAWAQISLGFRVL